MDIMIADVLTIATPDGPFTILTDARCVLASGWTTDPLQLAALIDKNLRPDGFRTLDQSETAHPLTPIMAQASAAVAAYYDGDHHAPMGVPVNQIATFFRARVWDELASIHPGARVTYQELARRAGSAGAVRAAGSSCASNAAALFVPCHRAVRTDGGLGGFRYGIPLKESLLTREYIGYQ